MDKKILAVDDELGIRALLKRALSKPGYLVEVAENGKDGLQAFDEWRPDIVLLDIKMPEMDGMETLRMIREIEQETPVIMLTAHSTVETAVEAMKLGAFDYLRKPFDLDELKVVIEKAIKVSDLQSEVRGLRTEIQRKYSFQNIVGKDSKMREIFNMILAVAPTKSTILIKGESGTGKELIAKAIHYNSNRRNAKFVKVNCASLSEGVLESELFGHEKGAFTGAFRRKEGKFEIADGGTILLDEISEMSSHLQAKLLRVIQEREFDRVGGNTPIKVDVRIIATTNRNLEKEVKEGRFREDLYYRLNVVTLEFPPLRERKSDIPLLAKHFIEFYARNSGKKISGISDDALTALMKYNWQGNVRELENAIERSVTSCKREIIDLEDLPREIVFDKELSKGELIVGKTIAEVEQELILKTLETFDWNRTKAADILGISIRTLRNKLHQYRSEGFFTNINNEDEETQIV